MFLKRKITGSLQLKYLSTLIIAVFLLNFTSTNNKLDDGDYKIIHPKTKFSKVDEDRFLFVIWVDTTQIKSFRVFNPWDTTIVVELSSPSARKSNNEIVASTLPENLLLGSISVSAEPFHQALINKEDSFPFEEQVRGKEILLKDTTLASIKIIREQDALLASVKVFGWQPIEVNNFAKRNNYCQNNIIAIPLSLEPGNNTILYELETIGNKLLRDSLNVYYQLEIESKKAPDEYVKNIFHLAENDTRCFTCHEKEKKSSMISESTCKSCHGSMYKENFVHGPVDAGQCKTCHNQQPTSGFKPKFEVEKESEVCFGCHEEIKEGIAKKKFVHAPVVSGRCTICHSPHASKHEYQLRNSTNQICLTCHNDKNDGNHPVVFHPFQNRKDPRNPKRELNCIGCHNPHFSEFKSLLSSADGYFALCQSCHNK